MELCAWAGGSVSVGLMLAVRRWCHFWKRSKPHSCHTRWTLALSRQRHRYAGCTLDRHLRCRNRWRRWRHARRFRWRGCSQLQGVGAAAVRPIGRGARAVIPAMPCTVSVIRDRRDSHCGSAVPYRRPNCCIPRRKCCWPSWPPTATPTPKATDRGTYGRRGRWNIGWNHVGIAVNHCGVVHEERKPLADLPVESRSLAATAARTESCVLDFKLPAALRFSAQQLDGRHASGGLACDTPLPQR